MKLRIIEIVWFLSVSFCNLSVTGQTASQKGLIPLGDPYILNDNGTYYMYGTGNNDGIPVYRSVDLKHWEGPAGAVDGLALHKNDVWGDKWFWAPEVYKIAAKYYMFFSVEEHIAVAVSNNPLGPFKQESQKPLLETKAIDAHLFIDSDGRKYLYYVAFTNGNVVWMCELSDDLMTIKPNTIRKCFEASQPWEKSEKQPVALVNEGPFMVKHNDLYYLVYSANHYANPDYGIGYASSSSPTGPWTKFAGNPILQSPDTLRGTGHCSLFTDTQGILNIVYHAHYSQKEVQPRIVYINRCSFVHNDSTGIDELKVMPQRIVPRNVDAKTL